MKFIFLCVFSLATMSVYAKEDRLPITVTGEVADETTKSLLIERIRQVYGADRVIDQLAISHVVMPTQWSSSVAKIINDQLKNVSQGQLRIDGNNIQIRGRIVNEIQHQQLINFLSTNLSSSYVVKDGLTVIDSDQSLLDSTLANRIIEFDSGSANLRDSGKAILNEMAEQLLKLKDKKIEIIGHTDNVGNPNNNVILSKARADAVKLYLISRGVQVGHLTTLGMGSSQPLASNDDAEGRNRNRRIAFRIDH